MIIKVNKDNQYVCNYSLHQLREDNPDVIFPNGADSSLINPYGVYYVSVPSRPDRVDGLVLSLGDPYYESGTWKADWEQVVDDTPYSIKRRNAYPSLTEQLDMQYWDKVNGTNLWQQAIATVKSTYPKES